MARALSEDLRGRVLAAVAGGDSARSAARRFGVGALDGGGLGSALQADGRDERPADGSRARLALGPPRGVGARGAPGRAGPDLGGVGRAAAQ